MERLPTAALLGAWGATVEVFRDPASPERRALDPVLAGHCGLSPAGLTAGLEAVLGGVRRPAAERLLASVPAAMLAKPPADPRPILVVLAANLPGLAVQPLLPALLAGRPVILKSPTAEPSFAPAFVAALTAREPRLTGRVVTHVWAGGDLEVETEVLARVSLVVAYGGETALADLARRSPVPVLAYGPKLSLAAVGAEVDPTAVAAGLAWDIALFDQRGCLSVVAVYTAGDAAALAVALARALDELAGRLPPGPRDLTAAAEVQQLRAAAELRGLVVPVLPLAAGTVVVEREPALQPSPGLRTVRVLPLARLEELPAVLAPWAGRLQGAALAGADAWQLEPALGGLGISRCALPGRLQSPDATWHNGGVHPLLAFLTS